MIKSDLINLDTDSDDNKILISCIDSIDISFARELKDTLMNALDSGYGIIIDLTEATRIDTACFQIFLAFIKYCKSSNIDFRWKQKPEILLNTAMVFGLHSEVI